MGEFIVKAMGVRGIFIFAIVIFLLLPVCRIAAAADDGSTSRVDFSYAFATPHRMAVALPDSSDKTLLDLEPGFLKLVWTYENLLNIPIASFLTPPASWKVKITPRINSTPFPQSKWSRLDGYQTALDNVYEGPQGQIRLEVVGGESAALVRATLTNSTTESLKFDLMCESQHGISGYNPAYVDPIRDRDCLLAGWSERADRVVVFAVGADEYLIDTPTSLRPSVTLKPGETRVIWLVRPYRGYAADLPALRGKDWQGEFDAGLRAWNELLNGAVRITIPDKGVMKAFTACLSDLFIMREPLANGYLGATPGTDCYRANNAGEASIVAVALDQFGMHKLSALGYQVCIDQQGDDGDWADPKGWSHLCWCASGFKAWAIMEHFRLTGDRVYLESAFPRMLKCSRFQEASRARTRVLNPDGQRPLSYGLMPRGMGDCGLKDGDDLYGFFAPHNIWAVYADRLAADAARILGHDAEAEELRKIADVATKDLVDDMRRGAIEENGYKWIPGVLGKTCGSRWGALNALFPCEVLPADDELVVGTLKKIRSQMSPGGLPVNTGWLATGMWVAISLDNLAETHLVRDEGDEAAALLYATLNHATPLITWCEERGQEPGAKEVTGDRQHLWTPVAVVRDIRDTLVMEVGSDLCLARGIDRDWLSGGETVGISDAPTHFGKVSYDIRYDAEAKLLRGKVSMGESPFGADPLNSIILHARLPKGVKVISINAESEAAISPDGARIAWKPFVGERTFEAKVE